MVSELPEGRKCFKASAISCTDIFDISVSVLFSRISGITREIGDVKAGRAGAYRNFRMRRKIK